MLRHACRFLSDAFVLNSARGSKTPWTDRLHNSYVVDVPSLNSLRINLDLFTAFFRRTAAEKEIAIAIVLTLSLRHHQIADDDDLTDNSLREEDE